MSNRRKRYYGWVVVGICMLMLGCVNSPIFTLSGLFVVPVSTELGVSRAAFSAHITICNIGCIIGSLLAGKVLESAHMKSVVVAALIVSGLCFAAYALAHALPVFYISSLILGICYIAVSNVTVSVFVNNWFPEHIRGKAMGIAASGSGIASFLLTPIVSSVQLSFGWRAAYTGIAGLTLLIALPLSIAFFSPSPEEKGVQRLPEIERDAAQTTSQIDRPTDALKNFSFWLLILFALFGATSSSMFNTTGYAFFCDVSISPQNASYLMSAAAGTLIAAKILMGTLCDKVGARNVAYITGGFLLLSYAAALMCAQSSLWAVPTILFFGFGNAVSTVVMPLIAAERFGGKTYAALIGIFYVGNYAGSGLGPLITAAFYDKTGSYSGAFTLGMLMICLMIFFTFCIYRKKHKNS